MELKETNGGALSVRRQVADNDGQVDESGEEADLLACSAHLLEHSWH